MRTATIVLALLATTRIVEALREYWWLVLLLLVLVWLLTRGRKR